VFWEGLSRYDSVMRRFRAPLSPGKSQRVKNAAGLWFARVFIVPHFLIGLGLAAYVVLEILAAALGSTTTATIQRTEALSSKRSMQYTAHYVYTAHGTDYQDTQQISASLYHRWSPPAATGPEQAVPAIKTEVWYFVLGPWHTSRLPEAESTAKRLGFYAAMAVFWNGIMSIFVYILWIAPFREWRRERRRRVQESDKGAVV
jgi:hypothetical protein